MFGLSKSKDSAGPKLPVTQLVILSICRFAEPVALTGVFPYLPEMIESFGVPQKDVAYWAGVTSAVFSLAQCTTAISWGRASDKYGRKPMIIFALICAMSSSLIFGFSRSLTWAIIARALSGASNGNVGILRTTVAELVPEKSLQPKAFSIMPLIWTIGSVVGPIIGGALASPSEKLPSLFGKNKFFLTFPFALPNLANAVFFIVGILSGIFFLRESLEDKKGRRDYGLIFGRKIIACFSRSKYRRVRANDDDYEAAGPSNRKTTEKLAPPAYREVFTPQSSLALLTYCILALHAIAYDQLLPVFMHLEPKQNPSFSLLKFGGGFGLESGRIGLIFAVFGGWAMVLQFLVFPPVTQRYGALNCMRACTFVLPIAYFITPYTVLMPTPLLQQAALLAIMFVKAIAGVFAFPCITILFTNSASSLRLLGTLNGVATSLSAIGRAAGPFAAGRTFTWGVENDYVVAAWWLLAIFAVPGHVVTWWLIEGEGFASRKDEGSDSSSPAHGEARESIMLDSKGIVKKTSGVDDESIVRDEDFDIMDDSDEEGGSKADEPLLARGKTHQRNDSLLQ